MGTLQKAGVMALSLVLLGVGCGRPAAPASGTPEAGSPPAPSRTGACDHRYFATTPGTTLTYATDLNGSAGSYTVEVLERTSAGVKLRYTFGPTLSFTQDIHCEDGTLSATSYADLSGAMSGGSITSNTTRASGEFLPRDMRVGSTWSSSYDITASISLPGVPGAPRTMNSTITGESRVTGEESVTVPAGTYRALKVESTNTITISAIGGVTIPPTTARSTSWFVEGIGMVKTTSEDASTELTSLERS